MRSSYQLLFLFSLLSASPARAVLYLEPLLGILPKGKTEYKISSEDDLAEYKYGSFTTFLVGARLGHYSNELNISGGVEFSRSMQEFETVRAGAPFDLQGSWHGSSFGLYFGYRFPLKIEAHWTYFVSSRLTSQAGTTEGDRLRGDGYALSLAYRWYSWLKSGIEYRRHKMEDYRDQSAGTRTITSNRYESKELLIYASFPLEIFGELKND